MSKIYQVVEKMLLNKDKITNIIENDSSEIFFVYNEKYSWSVLKQPATGKYAIYYYPEDSPEDLIRVIDWEKIKMVVYTDKDIPEEDAQRKLQKLYQILRERIISEADSILDEILAGD